jgi:hypothetical protein
MAYFENLALGLVSTQKRTDSSFNFIDIEGDLIDFNTLLTIILRAHLGKGEPL